MPGALLRLHDRRGDATVEVTPPARRRIVVRGAREQRMGEAHPPRRQLRDPQRGGFLQSRVHVCSRHHALDQVDVRIAQRSGGGDDFGGGARECGEAGAQQLAQVAGQIRHIGARSGKLEREERIATGEFVHAQECRPREAEPEPGPGSTRRARRRSTARPAAARPARRRSTAQAPARQGRRARPDRRDKPNRLGS